MVKGTVHLFTFQALSFVAFVHFLNVFWCDVPVKEHLIPIFSKCLAGQGVFISRKVTGPSNLVLCTEANAKCSGILSNFIGSTWTDISWTVSLLTFVSYDIQIKGKCLGYFFLQKHFLECSSCYVIHRNPWGKSILKIILQSKRQYNITEEL